MNINDYSTKVKNLADALASIGAHVDDEDLVAMTMNGLGKDYSQFRTSIAVRETFPDFQDLITLLISEEMRVVGTSSNGGSQESAFYSNSNRGRGRGVKTSFQGRHRGSHGGHHQHEGQSHEGGRGNFRGRGSHGGRGGSHRGQQPNSVMCPKFLVRPKKGSTMLKSESSWNSLPISNTKGGERGVLKVPRLD